jgi:tRNA A-37 threonylcarbamoyl transferase component Bud32
VGGMGNAVSDRAENLVERLSEIAESHGRELSVDDTWISVHDTERQIPGQGWKLHVSARPGTLEETLNRALPVLLAADCDFKVACSPERLRELNSGDADPGVVGKALTVYPVGDAVVRIGLDLADALAGLAAPRVLSDRRVRPGAPVYYRYGPFLPQYRVDDNGDFELVVVGPEGETVAGAAGPEFSCPPWATDPFRPSAAGGAGRVDGSAAVVRDQRGAVLGGRYRLTSGVMRGPRGNVYRAVDGAGRKLVIKEARAYVGENVHGMDLRGQLRNERRILQALDGVAGVPELVDHFRHGEDEYLVTTDVGSRDLNRYVGEHGLYLDDPAGSDRDLDALATQLVGLLDAVHERGVVIRDLSPKNVVLRENGACTLIDFGNSRYDGYQIPGWTRGYSVPDQYTDRDSVPADDYFSLGATLFFATTGMNPIAMDADPVRNLDRTLLCLTRLHPHVTNGVCGLLPRLLSLDPAERVAAVADFRAGRHRDRGVRSAGPRPAGPRLTSALLDRMLDHTVRECVRHAEAMMAEPASSRSEPPQTNVYAGSAGLGLELLHHPRAEEVGADLARWTARVIPPGRLPAALYFGRTGTAVYLAAARRVLAPDLAAPAPIELADTERADYVHGVAGIGTGHLLLNGLAPDPATLGVAAECARRLLAGEVVESQDAAPPAQPGSGVAVESGFAHGDAGVAYFLLAYARATGDQQAGAAARERFAELAVDVEKLLPIMHGADARSMSASWCQGMSGIVTALLHAAHSYDDEHYLQLAKEGARACLVVAPQAWVVSQCCGYAGIGEALIDVALATGETEFWRGAQEVAELMLTRSGGAFERPVFPDNSLDSSTGKWGTGSAGVLSFLRRLQRREGERLWTVQWSSPR